MKKKLNRWIVYLLAVIPMLLWGAVYRSLPELVPTNWGFDGQISYGPRSTVWILASMSLLLALMADVLPKIDPKKKNYSRFENYYDGFWIVMMVFLLAINLLIWSETLFPGRLSVFSIIFIGLGLLFLFMGNMMPKVKSNFFMGVRTPWTLMNEDVWNRTQRLTGKMMFLCGMLFLFAAFLEESMLLIGLIAAVALLVGLVPSVMSYIWYQKITRKD